MEIVTNLDYDQLDPGIRKTVRWLRSLGYETTDSGDGRSKDLSDTDNLDVPHVAIALPDQCKPAPFGDRIWREIQMFFDDGEAPDAVHVEVSYSARDQRWIVMVYGLDDAMLQGATT